VCFKYCIGIYVLLGALLFPYMRLLLSKQFFLIILADRRSLKGNEITFLIFHQKIRFSLRVPYRIHRIRAVFVQAYKKIAKHSFTRATTIRKQCNIVSRVIKYYYIVGGQ